MGVVGKVGGILAANIAKVEGVNAASIKSLMGINWPVLGYNYGYPAYGAFEPDVAAQWKFDEPSGDIYDCAGVLGDWSNFSGISVGNGNSFQTGAGNAAIEPGTGNFTIEWVADVTAADGCPMFRSLGGSGGMQIWWNSGTTIGFYIVYSDASTDMVYFTGHNYADGLPHKWRLSCVRDAANGLTLTRDGHAYGAAATGLPSAKTIASSDVWFGFYAYTAFIFREFRFSKNATNNSLGPNEMAPPYDYGSDLDPNVTAHWKFNESSGSIVDTIGSLTVPKAGSPIYGQVGPSSRPAIKLNAYGNTRTYNVPATGLWAGLSPGITTTNSAQFYSTTTPTSIFITDGFTYEFEAIFPAGSVGNGLWYGKDGKVICTPHQGPTYPDYFQIQLVATDGTSVAFGGYLSQSYCDGLYHKWRIYGTLGGTVKLKVDGFEELSASLAALSGRSVETAVYAVPYVTDVTIYEFRISLNATNNSGGPGGG